MIDRMNARAALLVAASALLLACSKEPAAANAAETNAAVENSAAAATEVTTTAAPAENAVAAAAPGGLSADYMLGKWSAMGENCSDTIEFRKDGTAVTPIGEAKWTLAGDKLTFDYGDGSKQPASTIKVLTAERIEITRGSGGKETEKRCP